MKKLSGSSPHGKRHLVKEKGTVTRMKRRDLELEALVQLNDRDIDTSDISEVTDWRGAVVGKFYRPIKEPVTLRLDADIIARLKAQGPGYQTRINALLREAVVGQQASIGAPAGLAAPAETEEATEDDSVPREFRFPNLEDHQELEMSYRVADLIRKRGSVFAPVA